MSCCSDMKLLPLLLLLTACSNSDPTPANCRGWGVAVKDGDTVTGRVVEERIAAPEVVQARCQSPFEERLGCALTIGEHEYVIWAVDDHRVLMEERCHAWFEERGHVAG